jgi:hypothetical protein
MRSLPSRLDKVRIRLDHLHTQDHTHLFVRPLLRRTGVT